MKEILLALLIVGCATPQTVWVRPNGTLEDFRRDRYACIQESRTSWSGGGGGLIGVAIMASAQRQAQQQAERLFTLCMEARGYQGHPQLESEPVNR